MSGKRQWWGIGWGVAVAVALSAMFVALAFLTSVLVAAIAVVPLSLVAGAARARAVPRATAHCLTEPVFSETVLIDAPKASVGGGHTGAVPAA